MLHMPVELNREFFSHTQDVLGFNEHSRRTKVWYDQSKMTLGAHSHATLMHELCHFIERKTPDCFKDNFGFDESFHGDGDDEYKKQLSFLWVVITEARVFGIEKNIRDTLGIFDIGYLYSANVNSLAMYAQQYMLNMFTPSVDQIHSIIIEAAKVFHYGLIKQIFNEKVEILRERNKALFDFRVVNPAETSDIDIKKIQGLLSSTGLEHRTSTPKVIGSSPIATAILEETKAKLKAWTNLRNPPKIELDNKAKFKQAKEQYEKLNIKHNLNRRSSSHA